MSLICPYCLSDQVIQVMNQQMNGAESSGLAASASFATIGATISKGLPLPVSPLLVDLQVRSLVAYSAACLMSLKSQSL